MLLGQFGDVAAVELRDDRRLAQSRSAGNVDVAAPAALTETTQDGSCQRPTTLDRPAKLWQNNVCNLF